MNSRIELNPLVCAGKPVIRGTRIPVTVILDQLQFGESWEGLLKGYPELAREDIQAALEYARKTIERTDYETAAA